MNVGDYLQIEIRDTGIGIPQEHLQKIFDPFFSTKSAEQGTGLGLAAVYGTIQDHAGAITVSSEQGVGTSFHLLLPCTTRQIMRDHSPSLSVVQGSGKILLVDDDAIMQITGMNLLKEMGYHVLLATNGQKAVEIFKSQHATIDAVLMDMIMPNMNGREAFIEMKTIDETVKVIIASGFLKDERLEDLQRLGIAGFILKPYRNTDL